MEERQKSTKMSSFMFFLDRDGMMSFGFDICVMFGNGMRGENSMATDEKQERDMSLVYRRATT
jgi:hypothetical protein